MKQWHAMNQASQLQIHGTLLVALSGILYGVLGYFGTLLLNENFSVSAMLFWRFFIAAIWMLGTIFFIKKNNFHIHSNYFSICQTMLFGILTYSGSAVFYFVASKYIGTGVAMVVFFSYPVFVTLFAWFFSNWQMTKHTLLSLAAVIVGLLFLKGQGDNALDWTGILIAMIAAFSYALYVYGNQHTAKTMDTRLQTLFICLGNALIFFLVAWYTNTFAIPKTLNAWFYTFAVGIIATALPIQLLLNGLKYISPIKASIISVLEPIVTVLVGFMLLNETLSLTQALGIMIVLLGAILIQFEKVATAELITEGP